MAKEITITEEEFIKTMADASSEVLSEIFKDNPKAEIVNVLLNAQITITAANKLFKEEE